MHAVCSECLDGTLRMGAWWELGVHVTCQNLHTALRTLVIREQRECFITRSSHLKIQACLLNSRLERFKAPNLRHVQQCDTVFKVCLSS